MTKSKEPKVSGSYIRNNYDKNVVAKYQVASKLKSAYHDFAHGNK